MATASENTGSAPLTGCEVIRNNPEWRVRRSHGPSKSPWIRGPIPNQTQTASGPSIRRPVRGGPDAWHRTPDGVEKRPKRKSCHYLMSFLCIYLLFLLTDGMKLRFLDETLQSYITLGSLYLHVGSVREVKCYLEAARSLARLLRLPLRSVNPFFLGVLLCILVLALQ